jgi:hypothetical protein
MSYRRGIRVNNVHALRDLALNRKSVYVPGSPLFRKHKPAAWIINLQGRILVGLFELGMFVYEPQNKT